MIDLFKFSVVFLGNKTLDKSFAKEVEEVYNKRNNIIHREAKRFNRIEVAKAVKTIEKSIDMIKTL